MLLIREPSFLGGELDRLYGEGFAGLVAGILEGAPALPPQLQVLRNLVSGEMDADRTDYLLRDSYHCGVDYGRFDHRRMIECLELSQDRSGELEIALNWGGIHTFEALILARYQMSTQVYYHRLRRIYDLYLHRYFEALGDEAPNTVEKIISHNDVTMMAKIMADAEAGEGDRRKWARRICRREHHRVVHETGVNADAMDIGWSLEVLSALQERYPDQEFLWDNAQGRIHKLLVPGDPSDVGQERLSLVGGSRRTRQMGHESQVLHHLPRQFQCARIFCDLTRERPDLLEEIKEFAARQWHERGGR
jgi:hypothetical protein